MLMTGKTSIELLLQALTVGLNSCELQALCAQSKQRS